MNTKSAGKLLPWLLASLLLLWIFPASTVAEAKQSTALFSDFDELEELCVKYAGQFEILLVCDQEELVFQEDFEIPSGISVTFRSFTVPEEVTLTVMEQAEIKTYALTVQGELINLGKVIQEDLKLGWMGKNTDVFALIPGHVSNKGEMVLTDVYGKRNIDGKGRNFTMNETADYRSRLSTGSGTATPTPDVISPSAPIPAASDDGLAAKIFDLLEEILPKLAFFFVLAAFIGLIKIGISSSRKKSTRNTPSVRTSGRIADPHEDHFQRDKRTRIEQLDEWLKNGLIDRKEYKVLEKRYRDSE